MFSRRIKFQIALFLIIAISGVAYAGGAYAGLGRLFGHTGYRVTLQLADSGGIFTNAEVSYRGVTVGRVGALHLTDTGVDVDLNIDPSTPKIPANTRAVVADRSAIGEQYVDLEADSDNPPYLTDGSMIPRGRTSLPPTPQSVLTNLDSLVASVPTNSLRTVVDELDTAFTGAGPSLQTLLDNANSFVTTASQHLAQTRGLLSNGRIVLHTQQQQADQILTFSNGLNEIAAQLKKSDPDLRNLIAIAPQVAQQVDSILRATGPQLGVLVANLLTTVNITTTRTDGLEEFLVTFPVMTSMTPGLADANDTGHEAFVMNYADPPECYKGYETTKTRPANDTTPVPANLHAYCAEPPGSPIEVRGSQNAPFGGRPAPVSAPGTAQPSPTGQPPAPPQLPGAIGMLSALGSGPRNMAQLLGLPG
ncbi:MCE family protein [Gandjariella thermophila]|uniref:ABC transporter substrate-binding protein n=1 Tax=Gandjariella thermophila TaxID=1931992 RepID=A0A4D4J4T8_9PSEU|nr:MCE family protein [Gandjariella thermophila]GDY29758.1 ABC transporter substrate-binding protein [Gandjariella thermophila]